MHAQARRVCGLRFNQKAAVAVSTWLRVSEEIAANSGVALRSDRMQAASTGGRCEVGSGDIHAELSSHLSVFRKAQPEMRVR